MKTKTKQFRLLWGALMVSLAAAMCKDQAPPQDTRITQYSCYKKNIDKEEKDLLGTFSNITGWIEKTPESYLSKVSQPYVLFIDEDSVIPQERDPLKCYTLQLDMLPVFHCSGNVFSKSDIGKRKQATISGKFFYKDCKGERLLFYDEGDGNPPFTYYNKK